MGLKTVNCKTKEVGFGIILEILNNDLPLGKYIFKTLSNQIWNLELQEIINDKTKNPAKRRKTFFRLTRKLFGLRDSFKNKETIGLLWDDEKNKLWVLPAFFDPANIEQFIKIPSLKNIGFQRSPLRPFNNGLYFTVHRLLEPEFENTVETICFPSKERFLLRRVNLHDEIRLVIPNLIAFKHNLVVGREYRIDFHKAEGTIYVFIT